MIEGRKVDFEIAPRSYSGITICISLISDLASISFHDLIVFLNLCFLRVMRSVRVAS